MNQMDKNSSLFEDPKEEILFREPTEGSWIEVRCTVPVAGHPTAPVMPWSQIYMKLSEWSGRKYYEQFFFVRKPPGLRLRFKTGERGDDLKHNLTEWINELERVGQLLGHAFVVYDPESYRFGGHLGLQIAHSIWSWDAELVIQYEVLGTSRKGSVSRCDLWALLLNDFLRCTLQDTAEIWDVWRRLADATIQLGSKDEMTDERFRRLASNLFEMPDSFLTVLTPEVRRIVERGRSQNQIAGPALRQVSEAGKLSRSLRSWLAANAIFQANRWGLGLETNQLRSLTAAMTQLLEPDSLAYRS